MLAVAVGTTITSDSAALHELVSAMLAAAPEIHCLRDPTRGGVATTLNELAQQSGVGMLIREVDLPIKEEVKAACELLGHGGSYAQAWAKQVKLRS